MYKVSKQYVDLKTQKAIEEEIHLNKEAGNETNAGNVIDAEVKSSFCI